MRLVVRVLLNGLFYAFVALFLFGGVVTVGVIGTALYTGAAISRAYEWANA